MAAFPKYIRVDVEIEIPVESEFTDPTTLSITADMKKANRFIKAVGRLCDKYNYRIKVTRGERHPPTTGSNAYHR